MKTLLCGILFMVCVFNVQSQLRPGQMAPEISLPNAKDSMVNLSSFKGKVVLVDFWASWCGPCRASNPDVLKLYKKYKAAGFEVFAVSIDSKKMPWLKAIRQDKLTYTQVNDNGGWYSKVAERYFVDEIPTSFLLDKTGKIVDINSDGKQLDNLIKNLL